MNVADRDRDGIRPLIHAVRLGHLEIVRLLLKKGATTNAKDASGQDALSAALEWKESNGQARVALVSALLDGGADVNSSSANGMTPLMTAANRGYTEVVRTLLDRGADMNARTTSGWTALRNAEANGHHDIAKLLRKAGAGE